MDPKNITAVIAGIFIIAGIAAGYFPPTYIANYETGECKYYFAGDEKHFNPLPNGTWYMVGLADENKSTCQEACAYYTIYKPQDNIWKGLICDCYGLGEEGCTNWCRIKNAEWVKDESKCVCPIGMEWNSSGSGCIKSPDYSGAITACSKEISGVISKLNDIEKRLDQSRKSSESLGEEFKKLKDEFSKLKDGKDNPKTLDESIQKIEFMLSELDMRLTDSDPTGGAIGEVSSLVKTLSEYKGGGEKPQTETTAPSAETTILEPAKTSDDSTLWVGLAMIVIVTLAGIYYVSKR